MSVRIVTADVREGLRQLAGEGLRAQCVVTSPPYWGLRDYGHPGQIGLEPSLREWVDTMVEVFGLVWDVLADDGVLWLNLGDSYAQQGGAGWQGKNGQRADRRFTAVRDTGAMRDVTRRPPEGLKPKDLLGQPWRVAFALQDAGWYLRSDVIWHKPNPMPESITDRPTKAHEHVFLLTKSERYFYDAEAIKEPASPNTHPRKAVGGWASGAGTHDAHSAIAHNRTADIVAGRLKRPRKGAPNHAGQPRVKSNASFDAAMRELVPVRNKRDVWTIPTEGFSDAHFATMPTALVEPCILAGSRKGDLVLDPFGGAGTVGLVADRLQRDAVLIELNPQYAAMARRRIHGDAPLLAEVTA